MRQGQIDHKLPGQVAHFTQAEPKVAPSQFLNHFLCPPVAQEKPLADKDQHVIAEGAARRRQPVQFLRCTDRVVLAAPAVQERFVGGEATQVKRLKGSALGFVYLQRRLTLGTIAVGRSEGQGGPLREETSRGGASSNCAAPTIRAPFPGRHWLFVDRIPLRRTLQSVVVITVGT